MATEQTEVTLTWDSRELGFFRGSRSAEQALLRSIKRSGADAARRMKAEGSRGVRERKAMRVARINAGLPLIFPGSSASIGHLVWTMRVSGTPVPVASYNVRQNKAGVRAVINVGKSTLIRGAFIATMRSGHKGVYQRRGKARLPIDELYTTRVSDVFRDTGMVPRVFGKATSAFAASMQRNLEREAKARL